MPAKPVSAQNDSTPVKNEKAAAAPRPSSTDSSDSKAVKSDKPADVKSGESAPVVKAGAQADAGAAEGKGEGGAGGAKGGAAGDITPSATAFLKGWGVGLAYIYNRSPIVSEATIVNGVVRATTVQNYQTSLIVGSHWYFQGSEDPSCGPKWFANSAGGLGCLGVFLGVGVGGGNSSSQLLDFVGGGFIWGFGDVFDNNGKKDAQSKKHSIGIGVGRRFNVKHLGAGFFANQPPPAGETQVRFETRDTYSPYLFYTYNF